MLFGGWVSAIGGFRTLVRAVGLSLGVCIIFAASFPWLCDLLGPLERLLEKEKQLHAMEIQTLKPGKCSLTLGCLQDHSGNLADRLPTRCYYNLLPTTGLVCK
jgi:hypothetical protein